jgi:hypothetical protein
VNLHAAWLLCTRIGATVVERGADKIINIGSLAGLPGFYYTGRDSPACTDPVVQARIPAGRASNRKRALQCRPVTRSPRCSPRTA